MGSTSSYSESPSRLLLSPGGASVPTDLQPRRRCARLPRELPGARQRPRARPAPAQFRPGGVRRPPGPAPQPRASEAEGRGSPSRGGGGAGGARARAQAGGDDGLRVGAALRPSSLSVCAFFRVACFKIGNRRQLRLVL